jgi:hypothetical protein
MHILLPEYAKNVQETKNKPKVLKSVKLIYAEMAANIRVQNFVYRSAICFAVESREHGAFAKFHMQDTCTKKYSLRKAL